MKNLIYLIIMSLVVVTTTTSCTKAHIEKTKEAAPQVWEEQGFEVVAYEGWKYEIVMPSHDRGAQVWHRLKKIPDNGITYSGALVYMDGEFHVYGPIALDAIRPH